MPVKSVIQFALLAVALNNVSVRDDLSVGYTHKTNGMQAKAIHPDRVASGGDPPYISSDQ